MFVVDYNNSPYLYKGALISQIRLVLVSQYKRESERGEGGGERERVYVCTCVHVFVRSRMRACMCVFKGVHTSFDTNKFGSDNVLNVCKEILFCFDCDILVQ